MLASSLVRTFKIHLFATGFALLILLAGCESDSTAAGQTKSAPQQLLVYSARQPHLIRDAIKKFSAINPHIEVKIKNNSGAVLVQQLLLESDIEQPDVLITSDAATMGHARKEGLLLPDSLPPIAELVNKAWRASDGTWTGITLRARTIAYADNRVRPNDTLNYATLAGDYGRRRLCMRTAASPYNVGFISALIHYYGENQARKLVSDFVANLATEPFTSDRTALHAIVAKQCWFTIANSYYLVRMHRAKEAQNVRLLFLPIAPGAGVHVNVSAAAVLKSSRQPKAARQFIEFLLSPAAQQIAWDLGGEFPVRSDIATPTIPGATGEFVPDSIPLETLNQYSDLARDIAEKAGYK